MREIKKFLPLIFIVLVLGSLRFINLGYSEYIPDETTVMQPLKSFGGFSWDFFLSQKKGPMQFVLVLLPYLFSKNLYNEFVFRIPFALANILALVFFYLFVKNESKNFWAAFFATLFLGVNGFIVAFGRIVQYQSLNMLFSFAALYFFTDPDLFKKDQKLKNSLIGTLFLVLSLLSHWDVLFVFPVAFYLFLKNFRNKKLILYNMVLALILAGAFLVPYFLRYSTSSPNHAYLVSRVGVVPEIPIKNKVLMYWEKFELYNPFFTIWGILFFAFFAAFTLAYSWIYFVWFLYTLIVFLMFFKNPGTHIYNLFIPISALMGFGSSFIISKFKKFFIGIPLILFTFFLGLLFCQSYTLFVDYRVGYPWETETIFGYKTKFYTSKSLPNNIIGFPIRRNWVEISRFINEYNLENNTELKYITNEVTSISNFYLDVDPGDAYVPYFAIGVKTPYSFVKDYKLSNIRGKHTLKVIDYKGATVARIYIVDTK